MRRPAGANLRGSLRSGATRRGETVTPARRHCSIFVPRFGDLVRVRLVAEWPLPEACPIRGAGMELVDAVPSQGTGRKPVWVRVPPPVPTAQHPPRKVLTRHAARRMLGCALRRHQRLATLKAGVPDSAPPSSLIGGQPCLFHYPIFVPRFRDPVRVRLVAEWLL